MKHEIGKRRRIPDVASLISDERIHREEEAIDNDLSDNRMAGRG